MEDSTKTSIILCFDDLLAKFVYVSPFVLVLLLLFEGNSFIKEVVHFSGILISFGWFIVSRIDLLNSIKITS